MFSNLFDINSDVRELVIDGIYRLNDYKTTHTHKFIYSLLIYLITCHLIWSLKTAEQRTQEYNKNRHRKLSADVWMLKNCTFKTVNRDH